MNFRNTFLLVAGIAGMMIGMHCSNPVQTAGNGSNVGNGMVAGLIVDENGNGVKGVTVYLRKRSMLADITGALLKRLASTADTTITNDIGKFVIDSIDTGTYVIEGVSGDNLCLNDSIAVTDLDSTVILPPDTLKPAGAIKGIIRLSEGGDPRKVFVLAFGIDRFARVEADGRFKFSTLAEAAYDLRIISSLDDYGVLDTVNIHVISADTTNLDTLELPFTGIPTVKGLSLSYDTLKQIVTLTWNQADTGLVSGYNVYRRDTASTYSNTPLNATLITDTTFSDSSGVQDETYEYKIKALDKNGNEGLLSGGAGVEITGIFTVVDSIVKGNADADGQFGYGNIRVDSAGNYYLADHRYYRMQKLDPNGMFSFRYPDSGEIVRLDVDIGNDGQIYVSDMLGRKIYKLDSTGAVFDTIHTLEEPLTLLFVSPKLYVASNSGIEVYDINDSMLNNVNFVFDEQFMNIDLCADSNGIIYAVNGGNVFRLDEQANTLTTVAANIEGQRQRIDALSSNMLILRTRNYSDEFATTIYLLNSLSGEKIAKWYAKEDIRDIFVLNSTTVVCLVATGNILTIEMHMF